MTNQVLLTLLRKIQRLFFAASDIPSHSMLQSFCKLWLIWQSFSGSNKCLCRVCVCVYVRKRERERARLRGKICSTLKATQHLPRIPWNVSYVFRREEVDGINKRLISPVKWKHTQNWNYATLPRCGKQEVGGNHTPQCEPAPRCGPNGSCMEIHIHPCSHTVQVNRLQLQLKMSFKTQERTSTAHHPETGIWGF